MRVRLCARGRYERRDDWARPITPPNRLAGAVEPETGSTVRGDGGIHRVGTGEGNRLGPLYAEVGDVTSRLRSSRDYVDRREDEYDAREEIRMPGTEGRELRTCGRRAAIGTVR